MIRPISLTLRSWKLKLLGKLPTQREFREKINKGLPSPYSGESLDISNPDVVIFYTKNNTLTNMTPKEKDLFLKGLLTTSIPKATVFFNFLYWFHYPLRPLKDKPTWVPLLRLYYNVINFDFFYLDRTNYAEALNLFYNSFTEDELKLILQDGKETPIRDFNDFLTTGKVHYES